MNVLITRPMLQAKLLAQRLQARGDASICLPVIDITAPCTATSIKKVLKNIANFNMLIFVSPNSVIEFIKYASFVDSLPCVLAIGKGTAAILQQHHINVAAYPKTANSMALLALPILQNVAGKKIAIFAGQHGKTLLADTLEKWGADVSMAYTHRRCLPKYHLPFAWQAEQVDISICTSLVGLQNFHTIIKRYKLDKLFSKALIVITKKMQTVARQLGFRFVIIVADDASDAAIILALEKYKQEKHAQRNCQAKRRSKSDW